MEPGLIHHSVNHCIAMDQGTMDQLDNDTTERDVIIFRTGDIPHCQTSWRMSLPVSILDHCFESKEKGWGWGEREGRGAVRDPSSDERFAANRSRSSEIVARFAESLSRVQSGVTGCSILITPPCSHDAVSTIPPTINYDKRDVTRVTLLYPPVNGGRKLFVK